MLKKLALIALLACSTSIPGFAADPSTDNKVSLGDNEICCCTSDSKTSDSNDFNCKPTTPVVDADGNKKCPQGTTKISNQEKTCIIHFSIKK
jgi:hypothetical protein